MTIQTCLFDLGNVLLYFSHARMLSQIAVVCGVPDPIVRDWLFGADKLQIRYETGDFDDDGFRHELEQRIGRSIDAEGLYRATADIFTLHAEMLPLLTELRELGLRLVLLSNTCPAHIRWAIERWPQLLALFDRLVLSYEARAMKPSPRIFKAALQEIACPPENCFYTDDIAEYVTAGQTHGLQAAVFVNAAQCRAELRSRGVPLVGIANQL